MPDEVKTPLDCESTPLLTMIRVGLGPRYICPTDRVVEAINAIKSGDPLPDYIYPAESTHKS